MTQFTKITANLLIFATLTFSLSAMGRPIGVIKKISGRVFVFDKGHIVEAQEGQAISDFASVSTEVGSQVSISDYHDRTYHLSGQGNITFMKNLIELKSGYLWVQGKVSSSEVVFKTSNAQVIFSVGEGIISYDATKEKTQVLAMSGYFDIANVERAILSERIQAGNFSFVQSNYENGSPRKSTPVGKSSYMKIVSLFDDVEPIEKNLVFGARVTSYKSKPIKVNRGRTLASDSKPFDNTISSAPVPQGNLIEKELSKLKVTKRKKVIPTHQVKINIYKPEGNLASKMESDMKAVKRAPSSISPVEVKVKQDQFELDLIEQYRSQKKHDESLNELIDALDSYKRDYNTNY